MLDFLLGVYLAGLAVRGWLRGFVRELMDLVGLVVGAAIAFRLSDPVGGFLTDRFGVTPEWGRIAAGILLFLLFGVATSAAAHFLAKMTKLPGLTLVNRLLGAAIAAAWGAVLVLVLVSIVSVLPVPEGVDDAIAESLVAQAIAGPDSVPRRLLTPIVGDEALTALTAIERITGGTRIVPAEGERVDIELVAPDSVSADPAAVMFVTDRVNADRLEAGVDPLAWSDGLAELAAERALTMYRAGYVERRTAADVLTASRAGSLRLQEAAEGVALASSERAAHSGIAGATDTALTVGTFDRVGVAVVKGPIGTMVVEVYGR